MMVYNKIFRNIHKQKNGGKSMKMKSVISGILTAALALSLVACGSSKEESTTAATIADTAATTAAETASKGDSATVAEGADAYADLPELEIIVASATAASPAKNSIYAVMSEAAEAIYEKSGGKLTVKLIWDGALGGDLELIDSVMAGDISAVFCATSSMSGYIKESAVFDMPCLYDDLDQVNKAIDQFYPEYNGLANEQNLEDLCLFSNLFRGLTTNVKIEGPEDFKGMTIRTAENPYYMNFYSNLGCSPTPLAFTELFMALQQGLVKAQDNPIAAVYASKFYEVQDYYMDLDAFTYVFGVFMNKDQFDALPLEYQELMKEFAAQFAEEAVLRNSVEREEAIEGIGDQIEILPMTDEIRAAVKEAATPVYDLMRENLGAEFVDRYLAIADSVK